MRNTYYNKELYFKQANRKYAKKVVYKIRGGKPLGSLKPFNQTIGNGLEKSVITHSVETFTGTGELQNHLDDPLMNADQAKGHFYEQLTVQVRRSPRNIMFNTDRNNSFSGYADCSPATKTEGGGSSHKSAISKKGSINHLPSPRSQKLSHFGLDRQASRLPVLAGSNMNLVS